MLQLKKDPQNRDVISLFSGAMGLDIGLTRAGLNIAIGQDFDAACVATMRANGHKVLSGDIRDIDPADLLEQVGLAPGEPFLICGKSLPTVFYCRKTIGYQRSEGKSFYGLHSDD